MNERAQPDVEPAPTRLMGRGTGAIVLVTVAVANASNYGFQLVTARFLGADAYGLFASIMSIIGIVSISAGSLQQISAKAITAGHVEPRPAALFDRLTRSAVVAAVVGAVALLLLSPWVARTFSVGVLPVVIAGFYVLPAALGAISVGRLQGQLRFVDMSILSTAFAVVKFGLGIAILAAGFGVTSLVAGLVAGTFLVALVGLWWSRDAGYITRGVMDRDASRVFVGITLFWILVSIDVPFARANFSGELAGQYAAAAVVASAVLWLPAVITQVAFPQVTQAVSSNQSTQPLMIRAFGFSVGLAGVGALGIWLFGETVFRVLYGEEYVVASGFAWKLAAATVPLVVVNLLAHHHMARVGYRYLVVLSVAIVVLVAGLAWFGDTPTNFALVVGVVGSVTAVAMIPRGGWRMAGGLLGRDQQVSA